MWVIGGGTNSAGTGGAVVYANGFLFFPSFPSLLFQSSPFLHQSLGILPCPTWIPGKSFSNSVCLDTSKPLHLLRFHRNLTSKSNFTSSPLDKRDTIRVQGFMDGGCP